MRIALTEASRAAIRQISTPAQILKYGWPSVAASMNDTATVLIPPPPKTGSVPDRLLMNSRRMAAGTVRSMRQ
ncbi:hypothetical protein [Glacieibacterium sp.]|uniref:hypothetical protein n=1 Tax=Glacieibacterium sp. TaxID=2860237 RepID=UPI003AFF61F5